VTVARPVAHAETHGIRDFLRDVLDYAESLLEYVAELRAESETKIAAEEGQRIAWGRMVEDGVIPATTRKQWIAQEEACPVCAELDGEMVELDGLFSNDAGEFTGPPLHPSCRCNVVLVEEED
jgi:hypothetical protein